MITFQLHNRDELVRQLQTEQHRSQEDLLQREKRLQKLEVDLANTQQECNKTVDEVSYRKHGFVFLHCNVL